MLFASICLDLRHIPANLLSLGALDFGMVVDGAVVMVENIVRHLGHAGGQLTNRSVEQIRDAAHEVQRPVFYAIGIIITAYLPIFTLQQRGRTLVQADGLDGGVRAAGRADLLDADGAGAVELAVSTKRARSGAIRCWPGSRERYRTAVRWAIRRRWVTVGVAVVCLVTGRVSAGRQRHNRLGISAASGRRSHLGARHAGAQHRTGRRRPR